MNEEIEALKTELRKANNKIKHLEEWKAQTLDAVRALVFDFTQIPEIFDGLEEGEEVKEILEQLRSKSFPFENVK